MAYLLLRLGRRAVVYLDTLQRIKAQRDYAVRRHTHGNEAVAMNAQIGACPQVAHCDARGGQM